MDKDKELELKNALRSEKKTNNDLRQEANRYQESRDNWKSKYKEEKKANQDLRPAVERYKESRDHWKSKYKEEKKVTNALRPAVERYKASRDQWKSKYKSLKSGQSPSKNGWSVHAKGHSYSLGMMKLVLLMSVYGGMSLRSCRHSLICMVLSLGLSVQVPTHVTIRNWLIKHGYGRLQQVLKGEKGEKKSNYCAFVDESMIIGGQKLLLVLGKPLSEEGFEEALQVCEMQVFYLGLAKSWNKKKVSEVLNTLKTTHEIRYVVSDGGSTLLSAIKSSGLVSVRDCSHAYARALENQYGADPRYLIFRDWVSMIRQKWCMTSFISILPPKMRVKSRFMNLFRITEWAYKTLTESIESTAWQKELQTEYGELMKLQDFILELEHLRRQTVGSFEILKRKGASKKTLSETLKLIVDTDSPPIIAFNKAIRAYLNGILQILPENATFFCCSDVIESTFGKFKAKLERQPRKALTQFILNIANFDTNFDENQIKSIFESCTLADVKKWFDEQK